MPWKFRDITLKVRELSCWQTNKQTNRQTRSQTDILKTIYHPRCVGGKNTDSDNANEGQPAVFFWWIASRFSHLLIITRSLLPHDHARAVPFVGMLKCVRLVARPAEGLEIYTLGLHTSPRARLFSVTSRIDNRHNWTENTFQFALSTRLPHVIHPPTSRQAPLSLREHMALYKFYFDLIWICSRTAKSVPEY